MSTWRAWVFPLRYVQLDTAADLASAAAPALPSSCNNVAASAVSDAGATAGSSGVHVAVSGVGVPDGGFDGSAVDALMFLASAAAQDPTTAEQSAPSHDRMVLEHAEDSVDDAVVPVAAQLASLVGGPSAPDGGLSTPARAEHAAPEPLPAEASSNPAAATPDRLLHNNFGGAGNGGGAMAAAAAAAAWASGLHLQAHAVSLCMDELLTLACAGLKKDARHPLHRWRTYVPGVLGDVAAHMTPGSARFELAYHTALDLGDYLVAERFVCVDGWVPRAELIPSAGAAVDARVNAMSAIDPAASYTVTVGVDATRVSPLDQVWVEHLSRHRWVDESDKLQVVWTPTFPAAQRELELVGSVKAGGAHHDAPLIAAKGGRARSVSAVRVRGVHLREVVVYLLQQVAVASRCSGTTGTAKEAFFKPPSVDTDANQSLGSAMLQASLVDGLSAVVLSPARTTVVGAVETVVRPCKPTVTAGSASDSTAAAEVAPLRCRLDVGGTIRAVSCSCLVASSRDYKRASRSLDSEERFQTPLTCQACVRCQITLSKRLRSRKMYKIKMRNVRVGGGSVVSVPWKLSKRAMKEMMKTQKKVSQWLRTFVTNTTVPTLTRLHT